MECGAAKRAAVDNVEEYLANKGKKLQAKTPAALSNGYRLEIVTTEELDAAPKHPTIILS